MLSFVSSALEVVLISVSLPSLYHCAWCAKDKGRLVDYLAAHGFHAIRTKRKCEGRTGTTREKTRKNANRGQRWQEKWSTGIPNSKFVI